MAGPSWLVDTNVLLRLVQPDSPEYLTIRQCTDVLWAQGAELYYTFQNPAEFWNVCTRPTERNGFGFSIAETDQRASLIESKFTLAPDSEVTYREWRKLSLLRESLGFRCTMRDWLRRCMFIRSSIC
jgi:hypothetical protein